MPNIKTIHRRTIQEFLGATTIQATYNWLPNSDGSGKFSLPEIVTALRWNRKRKTEQDSILAFVRTDLEERQNRGIEGRADICVNGGGVTGCEFIGVLTLPESARWNEVRAKLLHGYMRATQLQAPLPDNVDTLALNPSFARFIISGEADELPDDWAAFALSAIIMNCKPQLLEEAV